MNNHFNTLSLHLRKHDTLVHRIFGQGNHCQPSTIMWSVKLGILGTALFFAVLSSYVSNIILGLISNIIVFLTLLVIVFDCNYIIFFQSLKSYTIYYKTINIGIAVIALCIDSDFAGKYFPHNHKTIRIIWGITFILCHVLALFVMSLSDGYYVNKKVRLIAVLIALVYFIYLYFITYFGILRSYDNTLHITQKITLNWHSIALSTMSNVLVFAMLQTWYVLTKPNKVVNMPLYVKIIEVDQLSLSVVEHNSSNETTTKEETSTQSLQMHLIQHNDDVIDTEGFDVSDDHDIGDSNTSFGLDVDYLDYDDDLLQLSRKSQILLQHFHRQLKIKIDTRLTLLNKIILYSTCICCKTYIDPRSFKSKLILLFCFVVLAGYTVNMTFLSTELKSFSSDICFGIIANVCLIWILLNLNFMILKNTIRTFVFWWKMQDCFVLIFLTVVINFHNGLFIWSDVDDINDTTSDTYIGACWITLFGALAAVFGFAITFLINGFVNVNVVLVGFFIVIAMVYDFMDGWTYFLDDKHDVVWKINHGKIELSSRSLLVAKSVDIFVFLFLQLMQHIQYHSVIRVSTKVNKHWVD